MNNTQQRIVLLLQRIDDGPICRVQRQIFKIEILCDETDSIFYIIHENGSGFILPPGEQELPIPAGRLHVRRLKGTSPATVYAWS